MKPRRVTVMLELETGRPVTELRNARAWEGVVNAGWGLPSMRVLQAQANAIRTRGKKGRKP